MSSASSCEIPCRRRNTKIGRQYVRQSFPSASCAAGDSSCAANTTLQCVVVNATGQPGPPGAPPRAVREVTSSSAGTPPSMEKSLKAKPAPPHKITRSRPPAETNYTLSTKQKSLGRPRRFSDLTQDDRCAYVTSHCETLRNLRHLVSGTRI